MSFIISGGPNDNEFVFVDEQGVRTVVVGSATADCSTCGTSNSDCLRGLAQQGELCCDDCIDTNTHKPPEGP